ncbi:hypothetical protein E9S_09787, partial [Moraxella catarrhalis BC7]
HTRSDKTQDNWYTYGTHPRYGEIDYQYLRSKYGYDFKIKNGARNLTYKK